MDLRRRSSSFETSLSCLSSSKMEKWSVDDVFSKFSYRWKVGPSCGFVPTRKINWCSINEGNLFTFGFRMPKFFFFTFLRKLYKKIFFRFLPFEKIWTWTSKIDHVDLQRFMWSFSIVDHPIIEILWWKLDIICFDILHTKICMVPCFTLIAKVLVTLLLNIESICQIIAIAWCVSKHK